MPAASSGVIEAAVLLRMLARFGQSARHRQAERHFRALQRRLGAQARQAGILEDAQGMARFADHGIGTALRHRLQRRGNALDPEYLHLRIGAQKILGVAALPHGDAATVQAAHVAAEAVRVVTPHDHHQRRSVIRPGQIETGHDPVFPGAARHDVDPAAAGPLKQTLRIRLGHHLEAQSAAIRDQFQVICHHAGPGTLRVEELEGRLGRLHADADRRLRCDPRLFRIGQRQARLGPRLQQHRHPALEDRRLVLVRNRRQRLVQQGDQFRPVLAHAEALPVLAHLVAGVPLAGWSGHADWPVGY
ncbi:MAG: hypothetical protein M5R42_04175 [Rhodocyclaceae bacterium]|nr:hypothetical protein [Rhodocyclaceae bacterium]